MHLAANSAGDPLCTGCVFEHLDRDAEEGARAEHVGEAETAVQATVECLQLRAETKGGIYEDQLVTEHPVLVEADNEVTVVL